MATMSHEVTIWTYSARTVTSPAFPLLLLRALTAPPIEITYCGELSERFHRAPVGSFEACCPLTQSVR
eukprot:130157-Rhodomonas_salina.2